MLMPNVAAELHSSRLEVPRRSHAHLMRPPQRGLFLTTCIAALPYAPSTPLASRISSDELSTAPSPRPPSTFHHHSPSPPTPAQRSPSIQGAWWDLGQSAASSQSYLGLGHTWARARPGSDRCESAVPRWRLHRTFRFSRPLPHSLAPSHHTLIDDFAASTVCVRAWFDTSSTFILDPSTVLRCPLLDFHHPLGSHPSLQELIPLACPRRSDTTVP